MEKGLGGCPTRSLSSHEKETFREGNYINYISTWTEKRLESEYKPALTPKPMFFLFHKSRLSREMNTTTPTASLAPQVREFNSSLVMGPSTWRLQAASGLSSHHSLLHLTPSRLRSGQMSYLQFSELWLNDCTFLSLGLQCPSPALHLEDIHWSCRCSSDSEVGLVHLPQSLPSHSLLCSTGINRLLITLRAARGQGLMICFPYIMSSINIC